MDCRNISEIILEKLQNLCFSLRKSFNMFYFFSSVSFSVVHWSLFILSSKLPFVLLETLFVWECKDEDTDSTLTRKVVFGEKANPSP